MAEYIYEIESHEDNESEIFIGWIRNHSQELIRCKDCIYFNHEGRYRGESKWCSIYGREAKESDFCSWAERKEE